MNRDGAARLLAWFGIGLGVAEIVAPRCVAALSGLEGREGVIRAFGVREIAAGAVILAAERPAAWLWLRTLGDVAETALLASRMTARAPKQGRALAATIVLSPVIALDALFTVRGGS